MQTSDISNFIKKHTVIKNKVILLVFLFIIFYKLAFSLYAFSLLRFIKGTIGPEFFIIGIFFAFSNAIAILIDIPLGIMQKYYRPRLFAFAAVLMLFVSDLIFLAANVTPALAFLAILLYQLSIEIFFVTITTYILRLSSKEDGAQNFAQQDMADNVGDILAAGLGGILFVLDRLLDAHNLFVGFILLLIIAALFFFVYFFLGSDYHTALEAYLKKLKLGRKLVQEVEDATIQVVRDPKTVSAEIKTEKGKLTFTEIKTSFLQTFSNLFAIITNKLHSPLLLWGSMMMIVTCFWMESITFFEPIFLKDIYKEGSGWVIESVSRYLFESAMLITALIIPTFLLELPMGKLSDKWGKEKMVLTGTIIASIFFLVLSSFQTALLFFAIFLAINIGYVMIYPSLIGILGEKYQEAVRFKKSSSRSTKNDDDLEGESAGVIAIVYNLGQIIAGIVGGLLLQNLGFNLIFALYGILLLSLGAFSFFFLQNQSKLAVVKTAKK